MTDRGPGRRSTPIWVAFIAVALAVVIGLASLGVWQLQRLGWKRALIAATAERVDRPPVPAPGPADWAAVTERPDDFSYRRVELRGRWLPDQDTRVQATTDLGSGFWLLTPLVRDDGSIVLVNRGFVEGREPPPSERAVGPDGRPALVTVTGLLRIAEGPGVFPRRNDPAADRWFSRDVDAIAERRGLGAVAPYFVDAGAPPGAPAPPAAGLASAAWFQAATAALKAGEPVPGLTVVSFRNHHLGYALTWFVLALMTLGATLRVWRWHRQGSGDGDAADPGIDPPARRG